MINFNQFIIMNVPPSAKINIPKKMTKNIIHTLPQIGTNFDMIFGKESQPIKISNLQLYMY